MKNPTFVDPRLRNLPLSPPPLLAIEKKRRSLTRAMSRRRIIRDPGQLSERLEHRPMTGREHNEGTLGQVEPDRSEDRISPSISN